MLKWLKSTNNESTKIWWIIIFFAGCTPTVYVQLDFNPGQSSIYKVVNETRKDYMFAQSSKDELTEKTSLTRTEFIFEQKITAVDEKEDILANITIKRLSYLAETPDEVKTDFDSSRKEDSKKPLAKLVGQSYTIKLSPTGSVTGVLNVKQARNTVRGGKDGKIAAWLLSDDTIKKRHTILAMPDKETSELSPGDSWNRIKASPSGVLVPKSYEKTYVLKNITEVDGQRIATIEMNAIPTGKKAEGSAGESNARMDLFAKMFDSVDTFNGQLILNLETGKIEKYFEKLEVEHIASDSSGEQNPDKEPDVLIMSYTHLHSIEVVD